MNRLRCALVAVATCSLMALGCPEKKVEPPKPVAQATPEAPKPPSPPPAAEPRAVKECAAPVELTPPAEVKVGERAARSFGYKLSLLDPDADGSVRLGVLGPINEDSGQNLLTLKKYLKFFQEEKVDAILVSGDVGEVAEGIARGLKVLAESKLPLLVIAGNRECRAVYTDGLNQLKKDFSNVINMNEVRAVEMPELSVVSLPGYHDPNYINCSTGCRYFKSTVDEVIRMAKESKGPVLLLAHGPPHGEGSQALDWAPGGNVGDSEINRAIKEGHVALGVFSNIKEAGARASSDPEGTTQVRPGAPSKTLYLNPGPADTVGWPMNDGSTSVGLAAVLSVKQGQASYKIYRAKPLTTAEKAEAKKLDPPQRPEGGESEPSTEAPAAGKGSAPEAQKAPPGEPGN